MKGILGIKVGMTQFGSLFMAFAFRLAPGATGCPALRNRYLSTPEEQHSARHAYAA